MSQREHFIEGFPARDLRDAMNLYGLPGVADVVALEDMRGDGQDASGHTSVIPAKARLANALQRYNCICGQLWLCNHGAAPTTLKGDGLEADSGSAQDLIDYIGAIAMGIDLFSLDADELGDDTELDSDEDFYRFAADALIGGCSQEELMSLGWDPFKAVKKAVKAVTKTVGKVTKPISRATRFVTRPLGSAIGKVTKKVLPASIRNLGNKIIKSAISLTNPVNMLNPKKLIKAALPVAKTLVKSPLIKTVVGGAAIIFPPVGVPMAAALATASAVAAAVDSKMPGVRAAAQKVVGNTFKVIAAGKKAPPNSKAAKDAKGAEIALAQIAQAKKAQTLTKAAKPSVPGARRFIHEVTPTGRINRVMI